MGASQSQQQLETENLTIDVFHGKEPQKKISLPLISTPEAGHNTFGIDTSELVQMIRAPRKAFEKEVYQNRPKLAKDIMRSFDQHVKYYPASVRLPYFKYKGPMHPAIVPAVTIAGITVGITVAAALTYGHLATTKVQNEIALAKAKM